MCKEFAQYIELRIANLVIKSIDPLKLCDRSSRRSSDNTSRSVPAGDIHVQVLVKELRRTKPFAIC